MPSLLSLAEDLSRGCENYWYYHDYCEPVELARDIVGIVTLSLVLIFGYVYDLRLFFRLVRSRAGRACTDAEERRLADC